MEGWSQNNCDDPKIINELTWCESLGGNTYDFAEDIASLNMKFYSFQLAHQQSLLVIY